MTIFPKAQTTLSFDGGGKLLDARCALQGPQLNFYNQPPFQGINVNQEEPPRRLFVGGLPLDATPG